MVYFKICLSLVITLLTLGGGWVIITMEELQENQVKEKIYRFSTGACMIFVGVGVCILYKEYIKFWLI